MKSFFAWMYIKKRTKTNYITTKATAFGFKPSNHNTSLYGPLWPLKALGKKQTPICLFLKLDIKWNM